MSRFQFLIFTFVIALCLFLIIAEKHDFPRLDGSILSLLGISASSYLVSKGIQFTSEAGVQDRPPGVTVEPDSIELGPGQQDLFTATVIRAENTEVTWSIRPAIGTINAKTGLYKAPDKFEQAKTLVQVTATSVTDANGNGHAVITLLDPAITDARPKATAAGTRTSEGDTNVAGDTGRA